MRRPVKDLAQAASTMLHLLNLRYPRFVYGGRLGEGEIPVFCFHGVEPDLLERQLAFLSENGYATLDCEEYYSVVTGEGRAPDRAVVLTFDDGWGSLSSVGYPLFRRYGMKAVVFLAAGRIEHGAPEANLEYPQARDSSERPLLLWEEVAEMHRSGLFDFQSHSYSHALVFKSDRIVDFISPAMLERYSFLEIPETNLNGNHRARPVVRLGAPLYESMPRLSDARRLIVDPRVADTCVSYVEEHGGRGFFETRSWHTELTAVAVKQIRATGHEWRCETDDERQDAVRGELVRSKQVIEEELPGKVVRHLCYPWHQAGRIAQDESRKAGYVTNFRGMVRGRYFNRPPFDPYGMARVGGDFFFRLPGKGRLGLSGIMLGKLARRISHGSPYLAH